MLIERLTLVVERMAIIHTITHDAENLAERVKESQ